MFFHRWLLKHGNLTGRKQFRSLKKQSLRGCLVQVRSTTGLCDKLTEGWQYNHLDSGSKWLSTCVDQPTNQQQCSLLCLETLSPKLDHRIKSHRKYLLYWANCVTGRQQARFSEQSREFARSMRITLLNIALRTGSLWRWSFFFGIVLPNTMYSCNRAHWTCPLASFDMLCKSKNGATTELLRDD